MLRHWLAGLRPARRLLPAAALAQIEAEIRAAERTHAGEIRVAVETALGFAQLWRASARASAALQLFATLGVWDTAHNNGVLIYVLLADRAVEIVADRGIAARIPAAEWQSLCPRSASASARAISAAGCCMAVRSVARRLARFFPRRAETATNCPISPYFSRIGRMSCVATWVRAAVVAAAARPGGLFAAHRALDRKPPPAPPPAPVVSRRRRRRIAAARWPRTSSSCARDDDVLGVVQLTTVGKEDTLPDIARRFNVGYEEIVRANPGVDPWIPGAGRKVVVPTQFILPNAPHEGVVINLAAMRIYYYPKHKRDEPQVVYTHPIGVGKVGWRRRRA